MLHIKFKYKDRLTKGKWAYQECNAVSVEDCIKFYGLNIDCEEYVILSAEEVEE